MKAESIKKLRQIYTMSECSVIKELIEEIFRIEENQASNKFNWYNYTMNQKSIYTALTGVFHQDGYKIACDQHILVAHREQYQTELEGKIVNKAGEILPDKYPHWENVVPAVIAEDTELFGLDFARVAEIKKETNAAKKLNKESLHFVQVGEFYYNADLICRLAAFMDYSHTWNFNQHKRGLLFINQEGIKAVLQPMNKRPEGENVTIYQL